MIEDKAAAFREHGYPYAYGYLCGAVASYLNGAADRDLLEQQFKAIEAAIQEQTNPARKVDQ